MKPIFKLLLFPVLVLCLILSLARAVFAEEAKEPEQPKVEALSGILIDFESGRVLWEKDSDKKMAMASTTKIMTATLALERGGLDDTVTVSKKAAITPPVEMGLSTGEKITLRALLYALMLQSSNDAAVAIAEHIGGSCEEFCRMMTDKAREIGAVDTKFETPNGLDTDNHHSTAADMALITRYALRNEDFIRLINTDTMTVSSDKRSYSMYNHNRLLKEFGGANGVKTGFTNKAGHCFVGSADRNGLRLISVVLGSGWGAHGKEQKWRDTKSLLGYGFDNYAKQTFIISGDDAGLLEITRSKTPSVRLVFADGSSMPVTKAELDGSELRFSLPGTMKAPVSEGDIIGTATLLINGETAVETNILAAESAVRFDLKTCIEETISGFLAMTTRQPADIVLPEWYWSE